MMAAIGFQLLQRTLIARSGADSTLAHAVGRDLKGKPSMSAYAVAIGLAFIQPWIAIALYTAVAIIWFRRQTGAARRNVSVQNRSVF